MKIYWNYEDANIGSYKLYLDDNQMCYIKDVAIAYSSVPEHLRRRYLEEGEYEFGACFDGCSFHHMMKAKTLEDAKTEAEAWFTDYYAKALDYAKKRIKFCEEMIKIFNRS